MIRHSVISVLSVVVLLAGGCRRPGSAPVAEPDNCPADTVVVASVPDAALLWADSVMAGMTLEEMAGQLVMPAVYSKADKASVRALTEYVADCKIGGVVLLKGTSDAARVISDTLSAIMKVPPFVAIDAEWGLAMRLEDMPRYPRNGKISLKTEEDLMYDYGYEVARESRTSGINMVLGPVLDVLPKGKSDPGGVIGSRSFGSDPDRAARLGCAYARGVEDGGAISVAKHFPGHGSADADSHVRLPEVKKPLRQLMDEDLLPFRRYVDAGLSGVMTAHLHAPALDSVVRPVTVSPEVLDALLRKQMGFTGLVITDAINMRGASGASAADAILAGADLVLAPFDTRTEISGICHSVRSGRLDAGRLRDRVRRVLRYKYIFLMEDEFRRAADPDEAARISRKLLD